jgi:ParB family chromosome partitioning protein
LLAADQIIRRQLTVRAAEKLAQAYANGAAGEGGKSKSSPVTRELDTHMQAVAHKIRERLATHVAIHHTPKKGRIEIEYYGDDDLQRLLDLLGVEL